MTGKVGTADIALWVSAENVSGLDSRIESKVVTYDIKSGKGLYGYDGGKSFGLTRGDQSGDIMQYNKTKETWEPVGLTALVNTIVKYDTEAEIQGVTVDMALKALEVDSLSWDKITGLSPEVKASLTNGDADTTYSVGSRLELDGENKISLKVSDGQEGNILKVVGGKWKLSSDATGLSKSEVETLIQATSVQMSRSDLLIELPELVDGDN